VLIVTPLPLPPETALNQRLGTWLEVYAEQHPKGKALDGTLPEQMVATTAGRRRADRLIWIGLGRAPQVATDLPAIVVEFVSRARRDRVRDYVEKRQEYLAAGVKEYWIIDRFERLLTVARAGSEELVPGAGVYRPALLPGFELPLARLLEVGDRYEPQQAEDA
jgi:Uma2 family endonuclease